MNSDYVKYRTLEEFSQAVAKEVVRGERFINYFAKAELSADSIKNSPMTDVAQKAKWWMQKTIPEELIINHGSFIGEGMDHVIAELARKPDSNRALYSLINQNNIDGQDDKPIPSFMVFQCVVMAGVLYCTAYFRALEVCNFFRINLEEMRMNICRILDSVNVSNVRLSVFTFSAYNNPDQIPLEKCQLDRMTALKLSDGFDDNYAQVAELLDEKARETTAVIDDGLLQIKEWLSPQREKKWPKGLNVDVVQGAVDEALEIGSRLREARRKFSYETAIAAEYVAGIRKIAEEFRK
jgi:hypothetical protein